MTPAASLLCSCKVGRCAKCQACKRCGCDHNGLSVNFKMQRKRGQHGGQTAAQKRPKRAANSYKDGDFFVSPLVAKKLPQTSKFTTGLPPPTPVKLFAALETPTDVLTVLGEQDKAVSWYSHAPAVAARGDKATWVSPLDSAKKLVMKTAAEAAKKICTVLCGGAEEAGSALWERVRLDGVDFWSDDGPTQRTLAQTVAECYVRAPKSSIEKRVLRASLCSLKRESDIPELATVVTIYHWRPGRSREAAWILKLFVSVPRSFASHAL